MKISYIKSILKILTNRFLCNEINFKSKRIFCRYCLQCFGSERVLVKYKDLLGNKW